MKRLLILSLICLVRLVAPHTLSAQTENKLLTRYVAKEVTVDGKTYTGAYSNSGTSWTSPKAQIQDAINDLREYMVTNNIKTGGRVFVASGTYLPTESTEDAGGTTLNLSFKLYEGITLYGGFSSTSPESTPADRLNSAGSKIGTTTHYQRMKSPTILSGNQNSSRSTTMAWNSTKQSFDATFPGNSYHVVFFATNGFDSSTGRAKALSYSAGIDGCEIAYGNANNNSTLKRGTDPQHTAYGGGIYAVSGVSITNCEVHTCSATRNGGGIYLDGGGTVKACYVHTCQATGVGILYGQGGGVMADGAGTINASYLINNYAREGAGLAETGSSRLGTNNNYSYEVAVSASVVANNTSASEGGGIYLDGGGVLNGVSIYRNRCNGTGTTVSGVTNGQAAGIYAGNASRIYNSAIWGNSISGNANSNIQYATSAGEGDTRTRLYYCGIENHDLSDWTYSYKSGVFNLSDKNIATSVGDAGNYIAIKKPSTTAGITATDGDTYLSTYNWQPYYFSAIAATGIQLKDIPTESGVDVSKAVLDTDVEGDEFAVTTSLGARTSEYQKPTPATGIAYQEDPTFDASKVYTIFVDPDLTSSLAEGTTTQGGSWDAACTNLRSALSVYQGWKDDGDSRWDPTNCRYQVLCKEGTLNSTIATGAGRCRTSSIWMDNNVAVYGGYSSELTGTNIDKRNPVDYPTVISGAVMDDAFDYNTFHLVSFGNVSGAILDGFRLKLANAASQQMVGDGSDFPSDDTYYHGGAVIVRNDKQLYDKEGVWGIYSLDDAGAPARLTAMNNIIRNCTFTDNAAIEGAALHVSAADGTTSTLSVENCVFANNGTNFSSSTGKKVTANSGKIDSSYGAVVYAGANTTVTINHCDFLRNVGTALRVDNTNLTLQNTVFYANTNQELEETNNTAGSYLLDPVQLVGTGTLNVASTHNICDATITLPTGTDSYFTKILSYNVNDDSTYPLFANPTRNTGISTIGDQTYYGGDLDFTPANMNPMVNAASTMSVAHAATTSDTSWGTDMVGVNRDFGGLPDVGALENYQATTDDGNQQPYGDVFYVRTAADGGNDSYDGLSWQTAFATVAHAVDVATTSGQQIWVAEGEYTNKSTEKINSQYYAYKMTEGVNVYGGFPKYGNPGQNEREPKNYRTYLQPSATNYRTALDNTNPVASFGRVLVQPNDFTTETTWDGFTLRYGFLNSVFRQDIQGRADYIMTQYVGMSGGAGVYLMKNGVLENCEVENNMVFVTGLANGADPTTKNMDCTAPPTSYKNPQGTSYGANATTSGGYHQSAAGVYNNGGTIKNCVIAYNELRHYCVANACWQYGAGLFLENGTVFNTIIHDNEGNFDASTTNANSHVMMEGVAAYLVNGSFYNNTVVNNHSTVLKNVTSGKHVELSGIFVYGNSAQKNNNTNDYSKGSITMYNCIVAGNTSKSTAAVLATGTSDGCQYDYPVAAFKSENYGGNATYVPDATNIVAHYNYVDVEQTSTKNLCGANDKEGTNFYLPSGSTATAYNATVYDSDYHLTTSSVCYNSATEVIPDPDNAGSYITLPNVDADYTDRIKDCSLDIGAYEYNGSYDINPDLETTNGVAYYYVTQNGLGTRNAHDPANAACWQKLQMVLDAAGRFKYQNPSVQTIVKIAAFPGATSDKASLGDNTFIGYQTTRSVDPGNTDARLQSFMVPRGVELWGGYTDEYTSADDHGFLESKRDIMANPSYLLGDYSYENTTATAYHVLTFTDYVFDADGVAYLSNEASKLITNASSSANTYAGYKTQ